MRTKLAMAIAASDGHLRRNDPPWDTFSPILQQQYLTNADAAIITLVTMQIAATPDDAVIRTDEGYFSDLDDWLSGFRMGVNGW